MTPPARPEFSRPVAIDEVGAEGRSFRIEAGAAEREALARRYGLVALERLVAEGTLTRHGPDGRYRLEARLHASVVQTCVVTLEPVAAAIDAAVERVYDRSAPAEWEMADGESIVDGHEESLAEPLVGDAVDVGEAAAEQLALELDPFPRAAGVDFAGYTSGGAAEPEPSEAANPFAALAALRRKPESER